MYHCIRVDALQKQQMKAAHALLVNWRHHAYLVHELYGSPHDLSDHGSAGVASAPSLSSVLKSAKLL